MTPHKRRNKAHWAVVETRGYKRMYELLGDAKAHSLVFAVTGEAGCGKSEAIRSFAHDNTEVYVLSCSEYWNRKQFIYEILTSMGRPQACGTVPELIGELSAVLEKAEKPLIVFDEADKLSDSLFYFFITIYNKFEDHAGIVLCATDYLEKRIKKGVRSNRKGYKEIFSRAGRRFIPIQLVNSEDVKAVCIANGINDDKHIEEIIEDCDNDLRRVKRKVHAIRRRACKNR